MARVREREREDERMGRVRERYSREDEREVWKGGESWENERVRESCEGKRKREKERREGYRV